MPRAGLAAGVALAWSECGRSGAEPLLLLPPLARDRLAWPAQLPRFAAEFRCVALDAAIAHQALDRPGAIDVPTLVVAGAGDRLLPARYAEEVRDAIAGAAYRLFEGPGSSHGLLVERADEVAGAALEFLRGLRGGQ